MNEQHALYRFFNHAGELLYIGITANPATRWKQHRKEKPWWTETANITIETYPDKQSVLDAERAAILAERPRHNVVHNRGSSTLAPAPLLERLLPIQVGDWAALGLTSGDCPVGEITAVDDTWVGIRLVEFLMGSLTNHVSALRWDQIDSIELAYREDADDQAMDIEHLADFQTAWTRAHDWDKNALNLARREARRERAETSRSFR